MLTVVRYLIVLDSVVLIVVLIASRRSLFVFVLVELLRALKRLGSSSRREHLEKSNQRDTVDDTVENTQRVVSAASSGWLRAT